MESQNCFFFLIAFLKFLILLWFSGSYLGWAFLCLIGEAVSGFFAKLKFLSLIAWRLTDARFCYLMWNLRRFSLSLHQGKLCCQKPPLGVWRCSPEQKCRWIPCKWPGWTLPSAPRGNVFSEGSRALSLTCGQQGLPRSWQEGLQVQGADGSQFTATRHPQPSPEGGKMRRRNNFRC